VDSKMVQNIFLHQVQRRFFYLEVWGNRLIKMKKMICSEILALISSKDEHQRN
jgi:hypothetical protein